MGKLERILSSTSRFLNRSVVIICFVIIYVMLFLLMTQVLMRYFLGAPPSWTEELAIILFTWLVLLFATVGIRERFHVAIETIPVRMVKLRFFSDNLVFILVGIFSIVMIDAGSSYVANTSAQKTAALQLPISFLYLSIPVSGSILLLHIIASIVELNLSANIFKKFSDRDTEVEK